MTLYNNQVMTCIYQRSKYYPKAQVDPSKIIEPIGYKFFLQSEKPKINTRKMLGEPIIKFAHQKSLTKQLSSRGTYFKELQRILNFTKLTPRNNFNLNGQNLEFVNSNLNINTVQTLRSNFFPSCKDEDLLHFLQLLGAMQIIKDNIYSIRDYALSTFFVYYYGENPKVYNYINKLLRQEIIQYNIEILIYCPQLSRPQLRKIDYFKKDQLQNYISQILDIGKEKDQLFEGIHLYISDILPQLKLTQSMVLQETQYWPYLLFHVTAITGILNDGQHALLKIGGTFTLKSIEYVFLLKLAFSRVTLHKNLISNPFSNEKYVVCEYFNKENGRKIYQYLINNYEQILFNKENSLMVQLKAIYQNDFFLNVNDYNNISPIIKISKQIIKIYNENNNVILYPHKEGTLKKIQQYKIENVQQIVQEMEALIPNLQKKVEKQQQVIEKKAVIFDYDLMVDLCRPSEKPVNPKLFDLSEKKKKQEEDTSYINKYIANGTKLMQMKKDERSQAKKNKKKALQQ